MATLPAFFRKTGETRGSVAAEAQAEPRLTAVRAERDPFQLRSFPHEDLILYCKKIDNSRLVREPDPKALRACWSAIGAASVLLVILALASAPSAIYTLSGYNLETLRGEERRLLDDRRMLELEEARLLSPDRLERLARGRNLAPPAAGQVFHLENRPDSVVAMAK